MAAHIGEAVLLRGIVGGELLKGIEVARHVALGVVVGLKEGWIAGDQEATFAGLGIFGRSHDDFHLGDDLVGVLDPGLGLLEHADSAVGDDGVDGNEQHREDDGQAN